jgi:hypothetical protein
VPTIHLRVVFLCLADGIHTDVYRFFARTAPKSLGFARVG